MGVWFYSLMMNQALHPPLSLRTDLRSETTRVWAMGWNQYGQLADGVTTNPLSPARTSVSNVTAIAAGFLHSLFLKSDGSIWAAGNNSYGQLGTTSTSNDANPVFNASSNVVAIAAGQYHSLFIKSDGSLWAMGLNQSGQLGDGTTNNSLLPKRIVAKGVVAVSAGHHHTLFVKSDGTLWGMGDNGSGELGSGFANSLVPRQLTPGAGDLLLNATCYFGGRYRVLASTNAEQQMNMWRPILTNNVMLRGTNNFSAIVTNAENSDAQQFFILQSQ